MSQNIWGRHLYSCTSLTIDDFIISTIFVQEVSPVEVPAFIGNGI